MGSWKPGSTLAGTPILAASHRQQVHSHLQILESNLGLAVELLGVVVQLVHSLVLRDDLVHVCEGRIE